MPTGGAAGRTGSSGKAAATRRGRSAPLRCSCCSSRPPPSWSSVPRSPRSGRAASEGSWAVVTAGSLPPLGPGQAPPGSSSSACGGTVRAHRMADTSTLPAGRIMTVSVTGSGGMCSITLAHQGKSADRAGAEHRVRAPRHQRDGRLPQEEPRRGAGFRRPPQLGDELGELAAQVANSPGRADDAELGGDHGGIAHVLVQLRPVEGAGAEALIHGEEAVDLGEVDPAEQVRIVGVVRPAVRRRAVHPAMDPPDGLDRPRGPVPRCRRSWSRGTAPCAAVDPTGRPGSRSGRRRRPWPEGGGSAGGAPAWRRRTWRRRRGPAGSGGSGRTSAGRRRRTTVGRRPTRSAR